MTTFDSVISLPLARTLRDAGLRWTPASGDRFVVADRGMDDEVFTLSEMTVEVHQFPSGPVIGFNGTTEWALDAIEADNSIWLPSETQLRDALAGTFVSLTRNGADWTVTIEVAGRAHAFTDSDPTEAYGLALVHLIIGE